jgi:outer membrane protein OmpA-like peptidoglycan-associated protein
MNRTKLYLLILLLFAMSNSLISQEETNQVANQVTDSIIVINPKIGVFVNYGFNIFTAEFAKLPGIYSCCKNYEKGDGYGINFGALYDYPIDKDLWLNFRLGFNQLDGRLSSQDNTNVIVNGMSQPGVFEHILDTKIGILDFSAIASYRLIDNLFISGGAKAGIILSKTYNYIEKIKIPADVGTFEDTGLMTRNPSDGDIQNINAFQLFLHFGLSYELPLTKNNFLYLVPEINYSYGILDMVSGLNWKTQMLKGGFSIKYQEPPPPPPPPPAPLPPVLPNLPEAPKNPEIFADIKSVQIDTSNNQSSQVKLLIEDFISFNMRPLLNYIFFDENSSEIPKRYIKSKPEDTEKFSYDLVKNMDVLPTYYYVLDIIGKRLRENPKAKITIVGTNSNVGPEENNKELSRARAEAVKNYFVNVWNIPESQFKIEVRNLPKEASNAEEIGGHEENRRVEIISNDIAISEPVITTDTMRKISKSIIKFIPLSNAQAGVSSWHFVARQNGTVLLEQSGDGNPPDTIEWFIDEKSESCPNKGGKVNYLLAITDKIGQSFTATNKYFNVEQLTIDKKRIEGKEDKEYEFYSLILFDYGKSKLGTEHKKVADIIKKRITSDSKVTINGYTDSMGKEEINKKISAERANEFSKRVNIKNAKIAGVGESELLYDNKLPEGRFYCRTVKITIETPIKKIEAEENGN